MQVLEGLGYKAGVNTIGRAVKAQLVIVAANYLFTYLSLVLQKPAYEKLTPPPVYNNGDVSSEKVAGGASSSKVEEGSSVVTNKKLKVVLPIKP